MPRVGLVGAVDQLLVAKFDHVALLAVLGFGHEPGVKAVAPVPLVDAAQQPVLGGPVAGAQLIDDGGGEVFHACVCVCVRAPQARADPSRLAAPPVLGLPDKLGVVDRCSRCGTRRAAAAARSAAARRSSARCATTARS